ncbi:MAG: hypothetical protein PUB73_00350 [Bacteroidales bacterium]|nr:hypothetical protein [Bacteroidales bacterium]
MKTIRTFHRSVLVLSILLMAFTFEAGAQPGKSFNGNDFSSNKSSNTIGGTNLSTGLKSNVELAFGYETFEEYPYLGVTYSLGYQCNPYFYIGGLLGTGFPNLFIFAADGRAYFTKTKTAPFISTQLGFTFTYCDSCEGHSGVFFSFGPGVRFSLAKKMGLSLYPSIKLEAGEDLGLAIAFNIGFDF